MINKSLLEQAVKYLGKYSVASYSSRNAFIFKNISLCNKNVLDIGCGKGAISIWAAINGANHVVAVEPDADGGKKGRVKHLKKITNQLGLSKSITINTDYIQNIDAESLPVKDFDIAVMYNVVNHLDEKSVISLNDDDVSWNNYINIISRLYNLLKTDGIIIIADCARSNFWQNIGLKPPLLRNIEWNKHHNPSVWISLFNNVGFNLIDLRWSPIYPIGIMSSNKIVNYFTISHFILRFTK
jgi:cyclopropane fatty-acyl-phospholipid synthase-like methyltransferase